MYIVYIKCVSEHSTWPCILYYVTFLGNYCETSNKSHHQRVRNVISKDQTSSDLWESGKALVASLKSAIFIRRLTILSERGGEYPTRMRSQLVRLSWPRFESSIWMRREGVLVGYSPLTATCACIFTTTTTSIINNNNKNHKHLYIYCNLQGCLYLHHRSKATIIVILL